LHPIPHRSGGHIEYELSIAVVIFVTGISVDDCVNSLISVDRDVIGIADIFIALLRFVVSIGGRINLFNKKIPIPIINKSRREIIHAYKANLLFSR
jgi:hypothetical protein